MQQQMKNPALARGDSEKQDHAGSLIYSVTTNVIAAEQARQAMLNTLRCGCRRIRLDIADLRVLQAELDEAGYWLSQNWITPAAAAEWVHGIGAAGYLTPNVAEVS